MLTETIGGKMPRLRIKGTPGGEYAVIAKYNRYAGTHCSFLTVITQNADATVTGIDMDDVAMHNLRRELEGLDAYQRSDQRTKAGA
jgi:hypothetical protein